jgi:hypothetical protein
MMATDDEAKDGLAKLSPSERSRVVWEVVAALQAEGLIGDVNDQDKARAAAKRLDVPFLSVWGAAAGDFDEDDLGEWSITRWKDEVG